MELYKKKERIKKTVCERANEYSVHVHIQYPYRRILMDFYFLASYLFIYLTESSCQVCAFVCV